jgi:hypothetical protein
MTSGGGPARRATVPPAANGRPARQAACPITIHRGGDRHPRPLPATSPLRRAPRTRTRTRARVRAAGGRRRTDRLRPAWGGPAGHLGGRTGVVATATRGHRDGHGGAGGRRRHLRDVGRRTPRVRPPDRGGHAGDGRPRAAGRAVRPAGLRVRQTLARRAPVAAGRGRGGARPLRPAARLRVARGRDLLERAAARRGLRGDADDRAQRHLRRPVHPPGHGGPLGPPWPVGERQGGRA